MTDVEPPTASASASLPASSDPWLLVDVSVPLGKASLQLSLSASASRLALVGPSGAGKTTALRVIVGVERRARGRVLVAGEVWQDSDKKVLLPPWRRRAAWVPQDASLFPHRSVRQNLLWAAPADDGSGRVDDENTASAAGHSDDNDSELRRLAKLLEIDALLERRPRNLSGGERQRVALGRALLARPSLLLLDEPFSALDRARRLRLTSVVAEECARRQVRLLLVSHDEADVSALADEVYEIEGGVTRKALRSTE